MKPKKITKLLNVIVSIFKLAIELEQKQIEKLVMTPKPVPDYKKGGKELFFVVDRKVIKEPIYPPINFSLEGLPRSEKTHATKTTLSEPLANFIYSQEEWSKQLNQYLKEKGLNNSEPFGFAPVDDKFLEDFKLPINYKYAIRRFGLGYNTENKEPIFKDNKDFLEVKGCLHLSRSFMEELFL